LRRQHWGFFVMMSRALIALLLSDRDGMFLQPVTPESTARTGGQFSALT
jgi:hypothetical protein